MNHKWMLILINVLGVYAVVLVILIIFGRLEAVWMQGGGFAHPVASLSIIFLEYFILGAIVGAGGLIKEIKKQGKWKTDILRLIAFGLPSLVLSLFNPFTVRIIDGTVIINLLGKLIMNAPGIIAYAQVFLGYILFTSFYKSNTTTQPA